MQPKTPLALRGMLALLVIVMTGCTSLQNEPMPLPEKQIIVLWHTFTGTESQALQALTDQFNAENSRDIVLIAEYQEDISAKIETASVEHRPDLVIIWPKDMQSYITSGLIGAAPDLSSVVRRERADLLPMASALYTVNGTLQALPLGLITYLMYYNVDWLGDLGYTPATATWEDWQRTACAATNPLGGQVGVGLPAHPSSLLAFLTSGGAEIVDADGYYNFADQAGLQTATVLNAVLGGSCGIVHHEADTGITRLSHSSMAMLVESSLRLKEIEQAVSKGRNFKVGLTALPGPAGAGPTLWHGPGMVVIAPEGARRDAALNVLGWFLSSEAQSMWSAATHYLPVRRSLIEAQLAAENLSEVESGLLQITLAAAENGTWVAWPRHTDTIACRASLLRGLLSLSESTTTPGAYIDIAVTACNTGVKP